MDLDIYFLEEAINPHIPNIYHWISKCFETPATNKSCSCGNARTDRKVIASVSKVARVEVGSAIFTTWSHFVSIVIVLFYWLIIVRLAEWSVQAISGGVASWKPTANDNKSWISKESLQTSFIAHLSIRIALTGKEKSFFFSFILRQRKWTVKSTWLYCMSVHGDLCECRSGCVMTETLLYSARHVVDCLFIVSAESKRWHTKQAGSSGRAWERRKQSPPLASPTRHSVPRSSNLLERSAAIVPRLLVSLNATLWVQCVIR